MTRIAVSGATGFIGKRVVAALEQRGYGVRKLSRPNWSLEAGDHPQALEGIDVLVHAAAYVPPDMASPDAARACFEVNALGTLSLLRAAMHLRQIIVFSSGNIYRRKKGSVAETDPIYPSARAPYYLASKLCGEIFADHLNDSVRKTVILRPSAVYGPGMLARGLVPSVATRLLRGESARLVDGGRFASDLVCVDDVVTATLAVIERDVHGHYNVGAGRSATALEVARELVRITGQTPDALVVEGASGTDASGFSPLDISKAKADLGYEPTALAQGLEQYVGWLRNEADGSRNEGHSR